MLLLIDNRVISLFSTKGQKPTSSVEMITALTLEVGAATCTSNISNWLQLMITVNREAIMTPG